MKKNNILMVTVLWVVLMQYCAADAGSLMVFNVKDYGAVGDGETLDSPAINLAIEACNQSGGGTVYFPPGMYLSGSIRLKNNVNLNIDMGATILAAPIDKDYYDVPDDNPWYRPVEYQDFGHSFWKNSLIWGIELDNVAISGLGRIDGSNMSCGEIVRKGGGDKILGLKLCKNITVKDVTFINGGHFAMLFTGCDNLTIYGVKVETNRDGINLDCCKNVRLANCTINSPGDDAICLKSSYALGYKRVTQDITITNCMVSGFKRNDKTHLKAMLEGHYEGIGNGRIKFGTESNGGFKNITISNCVFRNCMGLTIQSNDGADIENISVSNIVMKDVVGGPISVEITSRGRGPNSPPAGTARNINIDNVIAIDSFFGSCINGTKEHPIENVSISNIQSVTHGAGTKEMANSDLEDVVNEPWQGLKWHMPSYGFFCRYVKNLSLNNIKLSTNNEEMRPAFVFDDIQRLELAGIKAQRWNGNDAPVVFRNKVEDVFISNCPDLPVVTAKYDNVKVSKKKVSVDQSFEVTCKVSSKQEGICVAELYIDDELFTTKCIWLNKDQMADVIFSDLKIDAVGKHKIRVGDSTKSMSLRVYRQKTQ